MQGEDLQTVMEEVFDDIITNALAGRLVMPEIDEDTFGIKAAIVRVPCSNEVAGFKLPAEGYFQLAFAYRIKQ